MKTLHVIDEILIETTNYLQEIWDLTTQNSELTNNLAQCQENLKSTLETLKERRKPARKTSLY